MYQHTTRQKLRVQITVNQFYFNCCRTHLFFFAITDSFYFFSTNINLSSSLQNVYVTLKKVFLRSFSLPPLSHFSFSLSLLITKIQNLKNIKKSFREKVRLKNFLVAVYDSNFCKKSSFLTTKILQIKFKKILVAHFWLFHPYPPAHDTQLVAFTLFLTHHFFLTYSSFCW